MLSKGQGGLEQAFVCYTQALIDLGCHVQCVCDPGNHALLASLCIYNAGPWDMLASLKLRRIVTAFKPDLILAHANRAITLLSRFRINSIPLVGVLHNGRIKHPLPGDALITVADHIRKTIESKNSFQGPIYVLPNQAPETAASLSTTFHQPVRIGVLARLSQEKGVDLFIEALAVLKEKIDFRVIIGGDGKEKKALEQQTKRAGLEPFVRFIGWVQNKKSFFDDIDIFCLTSRREGLPVVLLEAFAYSKPVVATCTEGAKELCTHGENAYLTSENPTEIADALYHLASNPPLCAKFITNATYHLQQNYSRSSFTQNLDNILKTITRV